jgi:response regulator RpfG family c-di-GMP phosphodiesterase
MNRLLLVDDDPNVVSALRRLLRSSFTQALTVECFGDPFAALERLRQVHFDVVLSDYRMPLMNGFEFLRQAREIQPHMVRMVLSASSDFKSVQQAINEVEVFRYLVKPWTEEEFIEQVGSALERAEHDRTERELADAMRVQQGELSPEELELRRLEELEPGLTVVEWGPNGEVVMSLDNILEEPPEPSKGPQDRR